MNVRVFLCISLCAVLFTLGCSKKDAPPPKDLIALEKKLKEMTNESTEILHKIEEDDIDSGTKNELENKRSLLDSRIQRTRKRIEMIRKKEQYI